MSEKILLVDDDIYVLRGYQRRLQDEFHLEAAQSGREGLEAIEQNGPFAVVVADMRMPEMDGIEFLIEVRERVPDTVRMMLTGNADLQTSIDAVNNGNIFRFLTKPCPRDAFVEAVRDGIRQYQLVTSEKQLLEQTLNGSIKVLIEILSLASPSAFSRSNRITKLVGHIASELNLPEAWQFKLAAMFSQIGCITLPPNVLEKINSEAPLTDSEQNMYDVHPTIGSQLLAHIPRLKLIARMVERQNQPANHPINPKKMSGEDDFVSLGAQMLKVVLGYESYISQGRSQEETLELMQRRPEIYNPYLLVPLGVSMGTEFVFDPKIDSSVLVVTVDSLDTGMIIDQDVWSKNEILLVQRGQEVTLPVLARLRNFAKGIGVEEPIRVRKQ